MMEHFSVFTATAAFLFLKMTANSFVQAYTRIRGVGFGYPEDVSTFKGRERVQEHPLKDLHERAGAAWRNDCENLPIFLVAALCGAVAQVPLQAYTALLVAFCGLRLVHFVSLLKAAQPWRFLSFVAAQSIIGTLFVWSLRLQGWS